jgi:hypothetical protein
MMVSQIKMRRLGYMRNINKELVTFVKKLYLNIKESTLMMAEEENKKNLQEN